MQGEDYSIRLGPVFHLFRARYQRGGTDKEAGYRDFEDSENTLWDPLGGHL